MGSFQGLTLYVPGIQKWDAKCNTSRLPVNMFGITYWITRDGLRAKPEEYVWKFFLLQKTILTLSAHEVIGAMVNILGVLFGVFFGVLTP